MHNEMKRQLEFIMEAGKLKGILRRTLISDGSRRENDAEHSWHLALAAMVLEEHAAQPVNMGRVVQMATVHDLVELYAGDTFAYDEKGNRDKDAREKAAADKLFAILPEAQGSVFRGLWEEFDRMDTPDSRYAAAMDRLLPFMNNQLTDGHTWREGKVTRSQVLARMDMIRLAVPALWPWILEVVGEGIKKGQIRPDGIA